MNDRQLVDPFAQFSFWPANDNLPPYLFRAWLLWKLRRIPAAARFEFVRRYRHRLTVKDVQSLEASRD